MKQFLTLLLLAAIGVAQGQPLRMKASSYYGYDSASKSFYQFDTVSYEYQGKRVSDNEKGIYGYGADKYSSWYFDQSSSQYMEDSRSFNHYDNNGNIIRNIFLVENNGQFDTNGRYDFSYNSQNQVLSRTYLRKYSGSWHEENRMLYSYDAQNNLAESAYALWDAGINNWMNDFRYRYTYANGKQVEEISDDWANNNWQQSSRRSLHYNTAGNVDTEQRDYYNNSTSLWEKSSLSLYHYDANNDNDTTLFMQYGPSSSWENFYRYLYAYDNNHNPLTYISQKFTSGFYQNESRETTTYNGANLRTSLIRDRWNNQAGQFEFAQLYSGKAFWYYELNTADIGGQAPLAGFTLYPNPAKDRLLLQSARHGLYLITDMTGKVMQHFRIDHVNRPVDVSGLPAGQYIIRHHDSNISQQFLIIH